MIKKIAWGILVIGLWVALIGCATIKVHTSNPSMQTVDNEYFHAEFEPQQPDGQPFYNEFRIVITNKSSKDFEFDWERTRYLFNGKSFGRFGFEGMTFEDLDNLKTQPRITIEAGDTKSHLLFPLRLVARDSMRPTTRRPGTDPITPGPLPEGKHGIRIVVIQDGKEIREEMHVMIEVNEYTK